MIRKYQNTGEFEPNQFSFNTKLKGLSRIQPKLPSAINTKPQPNLTPIGKQSSKFSIYDEVTPEQAEIGIQNEQSVFGNQPQIANGANTKQQIATGANTNTGQREAMGANTGTDGASGDFTDVKFKPTDTSKLKGSGVSFMEAAQMATPYLLDFLYKPKNYQYKRTSRIINPATGLPYETLQNISETATRAARGLVRSNKSSDLQQNINTATIADANKNQQINQGQIANAQTYLSNVGRMVGEQNQEIAENDAFNKEMTTMRANADAINLDNKRKRDTNLMQQLGNIHAMNKQEKEMKKAQIYDLDTQIHKMNVEEKNAYLRQDAANKGDVKYKRQTELSQTQLNLDKLKQSGVKEDSPEYIQAQKNFELAQSAYNTANNDYISAVTKANELHSKVNRDVLQDAKRQILYHKKGGLTLEERKDLKQQEYELKRQLQDAKEKSIEARERYKELKRQELEFRKEMRQDMRDSKKTINDFYKAYKK